MELLADAAAVGNAVYVRASRRERGREGVRIALFAHERAHVEFDATRVNARGRLENRAAGTIDPRRVA
jgi:hypothetical protein